jgi:MoaA/NifB/PqqE/SkfB family radical SAM enzyme
MKLKTDCDVIFFVSSSGHCTFDCRYCIIHPVAKGLPSLNYGDLGFLLERVGHRKAFLIFSGVGDFFAGYGKSDRLLGRLLDHPVEIALDTNGAMLRDFPELSKAKLDKIRYINLTMHYHQIKKKKLLEVWAHHARAVHEKKADAVMQDYIVSPLLKDEWKEALSYYERDVFRYTGKKLLLVKDIHRPLGPEEEQRLRALAAAFGHMTAGTYQEDFAGIFQGHNRVVCPAGQTYFRIWNDGRVQGCPHLPNVPSLYDGGNIKERRMVIQTEPFRCSTPQYCDCHVIEGLGKMGLGG